MDPQFKQLFKELGDCINSIFTFQKISANANRYHKILQEDIGRRQFMSLLSRNIKKVKKRFFLYFFSHIFYT